MGMHEFGHKAVNDMPEFWIIKPLCPTRCDDDCDTGCHEEHQVPVKRRHDPESCPGFKSSESEI